MPNLIEALERFQEAMAIREFIWAELPATPEALAASDFAEVKWNALAGLIPESLPEVALLLDALNRDVGTTGDATTKAIIRSLASYFAGLAAKIDEGSDAFVNAMLGACRLARADLLAAPASVPVVRYDLGADPVGT